MRALEEDGFFQLEDCKDRYRAARALTMTLHELWHVYNGERGRGWRTAASSQEPLGSRVCSALTELGL